WARVDLKAAVEFREAWSGPPPSLGRANPVRDERVDLRLVRNRERTLESLRLVRKIVPSGHGDEFLRPRGSGRSLPRDFEEIVPPEVHFLRSNRLELHVGVRPASLLVFQAFIPPRSSEASAARDGEPRNRPNRHESSRANRTPDRPREVEHR